MSRKTSSSSVSPREAWARLRFSIIGSLLASPAEQGDLATRIAELAANPWRHPGTLEVMHFSAKSIERWYYTAKGAEQPIAALERKVPKHAGTQPSVSEAVAAAARQLRVDHPTWNAQLLYDNLVALRRRSPELGELPGYATICRFLKSHGLGRRRRPKRHEREPRYVPRERRLFEVAHVNGLWHCDFHETTRKVLTENGTWQKVTLFTVIDDRSRLCCHLQWYLGDGNTEDFVHGLCQAFSRRGLPRALLSDNGGPMLAAETQEGLMRLSVEHHTTLAQTPEQNGKQEVFFAQIEGRLMPMLEGEKNLTLELLNRATFAWVEEEYQRHVHRETKQSPLERYQASPAVGRPCPSSDELRRAFRMQVSRKQRTSDGTVTVRGIRYEIPSVYRTLINLTVRVARWDLSSVDLVDARRGTHLATLFPVDREKNAERRRRAIGNATAGNAPEPAPAPVGIAPLLRQLMADYAATGFPPPYVTRNNNNNNNSNNEEHD